jgi:uncharacterized protein DUF885
LSCHPRSTLFGLLQVCNPIVVKHSSSVGPNTELTMTIKRKANGHADVGGWRHAFLVTLGLLAVSLATLPAQGPTSADFPSNLPRADQDRLRREALEAFEQQFLPAWRKLRTYMAQTYLPRVRPADSIASMKDGRAAYTILIHRLTTTRLSGADIHRLGEQEVARIEGEMQAIARNAGFTGSVADFQKKLDADPTQHFRSKEEMLANSRNIAMIIMPELPNSSGAFRRCSSACVRLRRIESRPARRTPRLGRPTFRQLAGLHGRVSGITSRQPQSCALIGPSMISGFCFRSVAIFVRTKSAASRTDSSAPALSLKTPKDAPSPAPVSSQ